MEHLRGELSKQERHKLYKDVEPKMLWNGKCVNENKLLWIHVGMRFNEGFPPNILVVVKPESKWNVPQTRSYTFLDSWYLLSNNNCACVLSEISRAFSLWQFKVGKINIFMKMSFFFILIYFNIDVFSFSPWRSIR